MLQSSRQENEQPTWGECDWAGPFQLIHIALFSSFFTTFFFPLFESHALTQMLCVQWNLPLTDVGL